MTQLFFVIIKPNILSHPLSHTHTHPDTSKTYEQFTYGCVCLCSVYSLSPFCLFLINFVRLCNTFRIIELYLNAEAVEQYGDNVSDMEKFGYHSKT